MTEEQLEDLLYESPWLLSADLEPVEHILGDKGPGRQIRIGAFRKSRRLDLLFKRRGRPVIVELKRGRLHRDDVAQILEYGAGLRLLEADELELYQREYNPQLLAFPQLYLVAQSAPDTVLAAAGIAGVEVVLFGFEPNALEPDRFRQSMAEWRQLTDRGAHPGLVGRHKFADRIYEVFRAACDAVEGCEADGDSRSSMPWWDCHVPFVEFAVKYDRHWPMGLFEFHPDDARFPLNEENLWVAIEMVLEGDNAWQQAEDLASNAGLPPPQRTHFWGDDGYAVFPVSRALLSPAEANELQSLLVRYLRLMRQYWGDIEA